MLLKIFLDSKNIRIEKLDVKESITVKEILQKVNTIICKEFPKGTYSISHFNPRLEAHDKVFFCDSDRVELIYGKDSVRHIKEFSVYVYTITDCNCIIL